MHLLKTKTITSPSIFLLSLAVSETFAVIELNDHGDSSISTHSEIDFLYLSFAFSSREGSSRSPSIKRRPRNLHLLTER